jgi:hypothetical protein
LIQRVDAPAIEAAGAGTRRPQIKQEDDNVC